MLGEQKGINLPFDQLQSIEGPGVAEEKGHESIESKIYLNVRKISYINRIASLCLTSPFTSSSANRICFFSCL
jgi:hypothetical protein